MSLPIFTGVIVILVLSFVVFFVLINRRTILNENYTGELFLSELPYLADGVKWFDDWYSIEYIDEATIAIGEPRYYQQNYSYLIIGESQAILFDTGSPMKEIKPVVESLVTLPVTAIPSHQHYDHVGNIEHFSHVVLPDLPLLRKMEKNGFFRPAPKLHLGKHENIPRPVYWIKEWRKPGEILDLGERRLQILHTPGHSPDSITLFDCDNNYLFTGDFIYVGCLYAHLPGSKLIAYVNTTDKLLALINKKTLLFTAHNTAQEIHNAPLLTYVDLVDLSDTLHSIMKKTAAGNGFFPRHYKVNERLTILTDFDWVSTR